MGCSERQKEVKRRRQRKKKVAFLKKKASSASTSEKTEIATKLRSLTPGAEAIISQLELEKR